MSQSSKSFPRRAKGKKDAFEVGVALWMDLLGYGSLLEQVCFDPRSTEAAQARSRLELLHATTASHAASNFPIAVLNDAVVAFRDLSTRGNGVTADFLARATKLHEAIDSVDKAAGFPGVRSVLAAGFRMRPSKTLPLVFPKADSILARKASGEDPYQLLREALRSRPAFGILPELHANFAFTKAYLAESSGTKGGLPGPAMYVDMALFDSQTPPWLEVEKTVEWNGRGMSAVFGVVRPDWTAARKARFDGLLGAQGVCAHLEKSAEDVRTQRTKAAAVSKG